VRDGGQEKRGRLAAAGGAKNRAARESGRRCGIRVGEGFVAFRHMMLALNGAHPRDLD